MCHAVFTHTNENGITTAKPVINSIQYASIYADITWQAYEELSAEMQNWYDNS